MGKLNYVNRKIGGAKLGQVVAKDLLKRLSEGPTRRAAVRDPTVDLDVSARKIDDSAVQQFTNAIEKLTTSSSGDDTVLKLEEMCLAGNLITVKSLASLAHVVRLSSLDLRDLDLSNNRLEVKTQEDAAEWERFLSSFAHSRSLRRLDLSGNPLGEKAFEILAKIYIREPKTQTPAEGKSAADTEARLKSLGHLAPRSKSPRDLEIEKLARLSISSTSPDTTEDDSSTTELGDSEEMDEASSNDDGGFVNGRSEAVAQSLDIHPGLRSVPYIVLDNTGMTETCALYMSYIIAEHSLPEELLLRVPAAKAGPPAQRLCEYDQDHKCRGIMYRGNKELGNDGHKLLELSERARDRIFKPAPGSGSNGHDTVRDMSSVPLQTPSKRRASAISSGSQEASPAGRGHDLGSLRSKIQGETLKRGVQTNDLWFAAIKMLSLARSLLAEGSKPASSSACWPDHISHEYRTELPGGFSASVWAEILASAAGGQELLSRRQKEAVVAWARNRATLQHEMRDLGMLRVYQIWRVLDRMGCLAYEPASM